MKLITEYEKKMDFLNTIEPYKKFKAIYDIEEKTFVHPKPHRCVVENKIDVLSILMERQNMVRA